MVETTNEELSFIEVWFTDQNSRPLEIEDYVNITLIIGISWYKWGIQLNQEGKNKEKAFYLFQENSVLKMVKS